MRQQLKILRNSIIFFGIHPLLVNLHFQVGHDFLVLAIFDWQEVGVFGKQRLGR